MNPILKAKIENGKLTFLDPEKYRQLISSQSGIVDVIIKKVSSPRSNRQNRYYWGIALKLISEHTGYTIEETHEVLKYIFLQKHIDFEKKDGSVERASYVQSTTTLNTQEFETYLENIKRWASINLGVVIPDPNEIV